MLFFFSSWNQSFMQCSNIIILSTLHRCTSFSQSEKNDKRKCKLFYNKNVSNITSCFQFLRRPHQSSFIRSVDYRISEKSLKDLLNINMYKACLQIDKECRWGEICVTVCLSFSISSFHLHYKLQQTEFHCNDLYSGVKPVNSKGVLAIVYSSWHFTSINLFLFI